MFGWFKKVRCTVSAKIVEGGKDTFISLKTNDPEMAEKVVSIITGAPATATHKELRKYLAGSETHIFRDDTYEAWDKATEEADAAEANAEKKADINLTIQGPPTGGSSVRKPDSTVNVKLEDVTQRARALPLVGGTAGTSNLGERIPAEQLAAMAQVAAAKAPSPSPNYVPKPSKVEENGTITFRTKVICPKCGQTDSRYRAATNTYCKCRHCGEKLLLEPATSTMKYDGRINQEVPAPDEDGYVFHASRRA